MKFITITSYFLLGLTFHGIVMHAWAAYDQWLPLSSKLFSITLSSELNIALLILDASLFTVLLVLLLMKKRIKN